MPNWCENTLTIVGEEKELVSFYELGLKESKWSLKPYHPYPNDTWDYDWCCDNWGTKWDCDSPIAESSSKKIIINFLSAWAPPVKWLEKVQADYQHLIFKLSYCESSMGFTGVAYTHITEDDELVIINEEGEIVEYENDDEEPVTYYEDKEMWITERGAESDYANPVNHLDREIEISAIVALIRDRRIDEILKD